VNKLFIRLYLFAYQSLVYPLCLRHLLLGLAFTCLLILLVQAADPFLFHAHSLLASMNSGTGSPLNNPDPWD